MQSSRLVRSYFGRSIARQFSSPAFAPVSLTTATKTHSLGEDTFEGIITDRWSVGEAPNGGYLMMMALNAASQCTHHPDPLSCTTTFLAKADENEPALFHVRKMMASKSMGVLHITMRQKDTIRCEHTAIFGKLSTSRNDGFDHSVKTPIQLPPRHECIHASPGWRKHYGRALNIVSQTDAFISPDSPAARGILKGKTTDHASITCYLGLANREIPTLSSLSFFNDAMFPPVLNVAALGWVPTLQYSVQFWNHPPHPGNSASVTSNVKEGTIPDECYVRGHFETDFVRNSWLYTDGEIWSHDGSTLLATSRQMARLFSPKSSVNNFKTGKH